MPTIISHKAAAALVTLDTTGSNWIIAALSGAGSNNPPTDTLGLTWHPLTSQPGGFGSQLQFWWAYSLGGYFAHAIQNNDTSGAIAVASVSFTGTGTFDAENGQQVFSGSEQPGPITTTENNEIAFSAAGTVIFGGAPGIDSGFTLLDSVDVVGGVNFSVALAYKIVTSSGTVVNPTWSPVASGSSNTYIIASFKDVVASSRLSRLTLLGAG